MAGKAAAMDITPEVHEVCSAMAPAIAEKAKALGRNGTIDKLTPVAALSQVVAGTNFFIKARVGEEGSSEYVHMRVWKKLGGGGLELSGLQVNKAEGDEIEYFDADGGDS